VALDPGPLPLRDAVLHCLDAARSTLDGHQLSIDVAHDIVVEADERGFERILVNLLTNAAKYSPKGSSIAVAAAARDGEVELTVEDRGIGIPHEEHGLVFERFFQSSTVSGKRGTGVGLSIVRRYVELLGGRVRVESDPGLGSKFSVCLPRSRPPGGT
jgi:signal transduction histidine kinase